jgi:hypothetical protein
MCRDPEVDHLLERLVDGQRAVLGPSLRGSYLFGSAATEDYEPGIGDVDTVAVLRATLTSGQLADLEALHGEIVDETPAWDDRVECVYLPSDALRNFRRGSWPAARIAPGEPFHTIELDPSWVLDWFPLRTLGVALWGPPPSTLVPPIAKAEYVEAVRRHLLGWRWTDDRAGRRSQAYAILTMCRGLRTIRSGELVSKREAARWGCEAMPGYADLIEAALAWRAQPRAESEADGAETIDATLMFIADIQRLLG